MATNVKLDTTNGNITVWSGDDDSITFTKSPAVDISDLKLRFTVKKPNSIRTDDSEAILQSNPEDIAFIESGTIAVIPINVKTNRINPGVYEYDIQSTDAIGNVKTYWKAKFEVTNDVTKTS